MPTVPDLQALRRIIVRCADRVLGPCTIALAGGAPRDLFHRRPIRDIDLFITLNYADPCEPLYWRWFVFDVARAVGLPTPAVLNGSDSRSALPHWSDITFGPSHTLKDYGTTTLLLAIAEVRLHPHPLNLILTTAPDPIASFDTRLSQCWIDDRGFRAVPGFHADSAARIVRWITPSTPTRLAKFTAKYPGWHQQGFRERCEAYSGQHAAPNRQAEAGFLTPRVFSNVPF